MREKLTPPATGAGGLSGGQLKLTAIIAMTADHLAWTVFPGYAADWYVLLPHAAGRIAAPIMWFFVAEGYHRTRDVKKYAFRLFAFAFISHFAYNFCWGMPFLPFSGGSPLAQTSVIWTLACGLAGLYVMDKTRWKPVWKDAALLAVCALSLCGDWGLTGVPAIVFIGLNRGNFSRQSAGLTVCIVLYAAACFFFTDRVYGLIQLCACLSVPLLGRYNGQRGGRKWTKWFFYIYYPAHLALFGLLRLALAR